MAIDGGPNLDWSFEAAADLSAKQFYFVKLDAAGKVAAVTAVTDVVIGVLQDKPTLGQSAQVRVSGVTKVSADVALVTGNVIGPSIDGQAAVPTANNSYWVGQVIVAAAAGNSLATAIVDCAIPYKITA